MRNEEECVCSVYLFRCNIFIGVRIIKEMPGSVRSGTPCTLLNSNNTLYGNKLFIHDTNERTSVSCGLSLLV